MSTALQAVAQCSAMAWPNVVAIVAFFACIGFCCWRIWRHD